MKLVTCTKCGWVHFAVTRDYAEKEVNRFNEYFDSLSKKRQEAYYGGRRSHISTYEKCWCGNKKFREFKKGDCPDGVTIGPVIWEPK